MDDRSWPPYSPDGAWWWSGARWEPTLSQDGRWRWTGVEWVRRWPPVSVPRWILGIGAVWLVAIGAWLPITTVLANSHQHSAVVPVGVALGAIAALSTVLFGGAVGRVARWRELAAATIAGTCALLFWYAVAMVSQPDPNGNNDQAAGAGAVILGVPTLIVVASLLCAGRGLGRWSARRSRPQGA